MTFLLIKLKKHLQYIPKHLLMLMKTEWRTISWNWLHIQLAVMVVCRKVYILMQYLHTRRKYW